MIPKISIQGDVASFHDIIAKQFFSDDSQLVYYDTFKNSIKALKNHESDFAMLAIENSLFGSINEVYDLVLNNNLFIFGEEYLRIEQCLIGVPGTKLSDIKTVYSHPVALAQCEDFLNQYLPNAKRLEYDDTATSVKLVKNSGDCSIAAIAGQEAAKLYGMEILEKSIETNKENYTRFVALSNSDKDMVENPNKTSLVLKTSHKAGALSSALNCFAKRSINLSKIQSRPIIGEAWHYMFYIDIDCGVNDDNYKTAINELIEQGCEVILIGSYINKL
jgi:prephenate dehydratase